MEVHQVSQRRACKVLQIDRSSVRYLLRRGDDAALRDALKRVSRERRRFGCRRVHVMVAREGCAVNYYPAMHIYMHDREQEDEAHLYRREAASTAQRRQETRLRYEKADGGPGWPKPTLELRCRVRRAAPSRDIAALYPAGQWTDIVSASWRLLMTSAARTLYWLRTHHCRANGLRVSWTASSLSVACQRRFSRTMVPSSRAWQF